MERKFRLPVSQCEKNFYKSHRAKLLPSSPRLTVPPVDYNYLSEKQKLVVGLVDKHLKKDVLEQKRDQLALLVLGCAGSGKSATLLWVKKLLEEKQQEDADFAFKAVSYTGMAAFNVNSETIHSAFHINPYAKTHRERMDSLVKAARDPDTARYFAKVRFLLIDEISTCGLIMLGYINKFLQLTHPGNQEKPFGGISYLFFGDPFQLASIADYSPWQPLNARVRESYGMLQDYYFGIPNCLFLDKSFRQAKESDGSSSYFEFLRRLRNFQLTLEDIEKIRSRMSCNLDEKELETFEEALHLYPLRRMAEKRNSDSIRSRYKEKVFTIRNGVRDLELALGCRVMLRTNLCLKAGLCNGSTGTLVAVNFTNSFMKKQGTNNNLDGRIFNAEDVECLLINFPDYVGNLLAESESGDVGMPVFKISETVDFEGEKITVDTFKVELAYGATIHKAQGLTLDLAAICLSGEEWFSGLDYVAFSRTRQLNHIMILDPEVKDIRFTWHKGKSVNRLKLSMVEEKRVREKEMNMMAQIMYSNH